MTDAEAYGAAFVGSTTVVTIATSLVTLLRNKASKGEMRPLSQDDVNSLRTVVDNLAASHTRGQIDSAEIKKDISHILEKMDRMEEQRERDHAEVKKLSRILYPLLKDEIVAQRKKMGLDPGTDEMPVTA